MPITQAKRSSRGTSNKPTGRKKKSQSRANRRTSRRTYKPTSPPQSPLLGRFSPERKVDLVGALMVIIGVLTVFSLFSANQGLTNSWVSILRSIFGWGMFILPLGLILVGLWLIARHVERLPVLSIERVVGMLLLFFNLLVIFHAISGSYEQAALRALEGRGGGSIGNLILQGLVGGLGSAGMVTLLIAWLLIALAMTFDLSFQQMFAWTASLVDKIQRRLRFIFRKRFTRPTQEIPPTPSKDIAPLRLTSIKTPATNPLSGVTIKTGIPSAPAVSWILPKVDEILEVAQAPAVNQEFIEKHARLIEETLASFGAPSQVIKISRGPVITMFGVEPLFVESRNGRTRVRVGKIVSLADDLALALAAPRIRIQAPVPGHGYVGIEVPNEEMTLVTLREIIESEVFQRGKSPLRFALGKDVAGHSRVANIDSMPHLLIAGTTGSGKSVCVNSILSCFLLHNTPDNLRLILIDPKRVELSNYNGIPHLLAPVVVEIERVVGALQWMTREMDNRYHKFAEIGARNIQDYNTRVAAQGGKILPALIVVIDELADLMMIAPDETERTITRLAQLARATGIHLIIATQRPSADVVTGLIKANFPARIAFAVASNVDSRVILDQPGAERLLGKGDMLFQAPEAAAPLRLQGVFVSDLEINRLVDYWKPQTQLRDSSSVGEPDQPSESIPLNAPLKQASMFDEMTSEMKVDPLLEDAIELVRREKRASVSMLQRRLRIGYTRAARLVDTMEEKGIISASQSNSQVRHVLDDGEAAPQKEE